MMWRILYRVKRLFRNPAVLTRDDVAYIFGVPVKLIPERKIPLKDE